MLTTSIVLYKTPRNQIETVLKSVFDSNCVDKIYIIDNSPTDALSYVKDISPLIEYIPHENTGYGSSHNIGIKKSLEVDANYHIVLNPDIPAINIPFSSSEVSFFELDNINSLSKAVDIALKNKLSNKESLRHSVVEKYSLDLMCEKYKKLYISLQQ